MRPGPTDGSAAPVADSDLGRGRRHVPGIRHPRCHRSTAQDGARADGRDILLEPRSSFGVYEAAHYSTHGTRPDRIGQAHTAVARPTNASPRRTASSRLMRAAELLGALHLHHRPSRAPRGCSFQVERRPRAQQHGAGRHHRKRPRPRSRRPIGSKSSRSGHPLRSGPALR